MPVFNTARFVTEALRSIREQQFTDFELIVVDDGSTDGSTGILRSFAQQEPRMRLIQRANLGLIATRNELLREASGEFIAWMDSDDVSHPGRLAQQVAAFDRGPELVSVGTNVQLVDQDGEPLGVESYHQHDDEIRADQTHGSGMRFASTMQPRSVAQSVGGFRAPFKMGEDFDYLLRIAERGRMANVPSVLYVYRQHLLNTCTAHGKNWPRYRAIILDLAAQRREGGTDQLQRGEDLTFPPADPSDVRHFIPIVLLEWAKGALSTGDRARAVRYTWKAIRTAPLQSASWRYLARLLLLRS